MKARDVLIIVLACVFAWAVYKEWAKFHKNKVKIKNTKNAVDSLLNTLGIKKQSDLFDINENQNYKNEIVYTFAFHSFNNTYYYYTYALKACFFSNMGFCIYLYERIL